MARKRGRAKATTATRPINVVVDLSHHNETVDFAKMKAAGIVGVIHKATQGLTYVDETYAGRRVEALVRMAQREQKRHRLDEEEAHRQQVRDHAERGEGHHQKGVGQEDQGGKKRHHQPDLAERVPVRQGVIGDHAEEQCDR